MPHTIIYNVTTHFHTAPLDTTLWNKTTIKLMPNLYKPIRRPYIYYHPKLEPYPQRTIIPQEELSSAAGCGEGAASSAQAGCGDGASSAEARSLEVASSAQARCNEGPLSSGVPSVPAPSSMYYVCAPPHALGTSRHSCQCQHATVAGLPGSAAADWVPWGPPYWRDRGHCSTSGPPSCPL